jgi:hypothetical protein
MLDVRQSGSPKKRAGLQSDDNCDPRGGPERFIWPDKELA